MKKAILILAIVSLSSAWAYKITNTFAKDAVKNQKFERVLDMEYLFKDTKVFTKLVPLLDNSAEGRQVTQSLLDLGNLIKQAEETGPAQTISELTELLNTTASLAQVTLENRGNVSQAETINSAEIMYGLVSRARNMVTTNWTPMQKGNALDFMKRVVKKVEGNPLKPGISLENALMESVKEMSEVFGERPSWKIVEELTINCKRA